MLARGVDPADDPVSQRLDAGEFQRRLGLYGFHAFTPAH
jgi:hypothetical protein